MKLITSIGRNDGTLHETRYRKFSAEREMMLARGKGILPTSRNLQSKVVLVTSESTLAKPSELLKD